MVTITKPQNGETFPDGSNIGFTCNVATGFGTQPYTYQWESSVDGVLSDQPSFDTRTLSVNCPDFALDCSPLPHTISVTVTDAKGLAASDSIQLTMSGPCDECGDPADLNGDKVVDLADFSILGSRFLSQSGQPE